MQFYAYLPIAAIAIGLLARYHYIAKKAERVDVAEAEAKSAKRNLTAYQARVEAQAKRDAAQRDKDTKADQALSKALSDQRAVSDGLRRELALLRTTTERTNAQGVTC